MNNIRQQKYHECQCIYIGNRTTRRQTNSRSVKSRTGQLAD